MKTIKISPADNVAVTLVPITKGEEVFGVTAREDIPQGHKIALTDIHAGERVIKYGFTIGTVKSDIHAGHHVHTHNVKTAISEHSEYTYTPDIHMLARTEDAWFDGYLRKDGSAGVRNEIWIIPTVGCVNSVAEKLAKDNADLAVGTVEGIYAFPHPYGCSQLGDDHGLKVVKFFPANVYGGLSAMKALSGPFPGIRFIPTGGVSLQNVAEYISAPFIHAVGGSWVCPKADINAGNFSKITQICKETRQALLGFEMAHIGINCADAGTSMEVCRKLNEAFNLPVKEGTSSNFASSGVEVMKTMFKGQNGHIAIRTNKMIPAIAEMERRGFKLDMDSIKDKDNIKAIYLTDEFGGFAVHLLQK